jgi:hypothetical protein
MASKTIYKKTTLVEAQTRNMRPLKEEQKAKISKVVGNFIKYLKITHS